MHHYSRFKALMAVGPFIEEHPRGWALFCRSSRRSTEDTYDRLIDLFCFEQTKWNIAKKVIKHLDKVPDPDKCSDDVVQRLWVRYRDPRSALSIFERRHRTT